MRFNGFSRILSGLILSLVVAVFGGTSSQASTWRVERDGSGDFTTIQPAVDGAAPGDTILIGPGDYIEATSVLVEGYAYPTDVFVNVTVADLTFIGTSSGDVTIGPDEFYSTYQGPIGFSFGNISGTLRIEKMAIKNVDKGCRSGLGRIELIDCTLTDMENMGILSYSPSGLFVDRCSFEQADWAILTFPPCTGVIIQNCEMVNGKVSVYGASDVVMENCTSVGGSLTTGGGGIQFNNSSGRVSNCEFHNHTSYSVSAKNGSNVVIDNSTLVADGLVNNGVGIHSWASSTVIVDDCIVDGSYSAFYLRSDGQVSVDSCHINTTGLWFVYVDSYGGPPIDLDFTNNYWGTTDLELISSQIMDSNDDDELSFTIIFEPIADGPLPTSKTSLDGLKALYR